MKKLFSLVTLAALLPLAAFSQVVTGGSSLFPGSVDPTTGGGNVTSVFGRTGDVIADPGDYASYYGQLTANNSWTGVNTFAGSFIFTPATITIAANAGSIDITKGASIASVSASVALTPTGAGTNGQQVAIYVSNSSGSAIVVTGGGTASTITYTVPTNSTLLTYWVSNGAAWSLKGGAPNIVDLPDNATPATTDVIAAQNPTTGTVSKSTVAQVSTAVRASLPSRICTFMVSGAGAAITTGTVNGTVTIAGPFTLTGWSISATGATGTITVKIWNKAYSTAIPTIANVINTNGVSLTTGTSVYSTTITDFTDTTFAAQDQFRCAVTAVDGAATDLTVTLYGTPL